MLVGVVTAAVVVAVAAAVAMAMAGAATVADVVVVVLDIVFVVAVVHFAVAVAAGSMFFVNCDTCMLRRVSLMAEEVVCLGHSLPWVQCESSVDQETIVDGIQ